MNQTRHIDVERIHERTGRAKPIKLLREDGTIAGTVDVETVLEGLVRKNQVEALIDNLPECACCKRKVAPVDRNPGFKKLVVCKTCPSCECGTALGTWLMQPRPMAARMGGRPRCPKCRPEPCARAGCDRTFTKLSSQQMYCESCSARQCCVCGANMHHLMCQRSLAKGELPKCRECWLKVQRIGFPKCKDCDSPARDRNGSRCRPCGIMWNRARKEAAGIGKKCVECSALVKDRRSARCPPCSRAECSDRRSEAMRLAWVARRRKASGNQP